MLTTEPGQATCPSAQRLASAPVRSRSPSVSHTRADAEEIARAALQRGAGNIRQAFERAWRSQLDMPQALAKVSGDEGMLARASLTVLRCLEDKLHAGAFIASPSAP